MNDKHLNIKKNKGVLVVLEGISGSGKSECVKKLRNNCSEKGYKYCIVEWNSNKTIRNIIKRLYSKKILTPVMYSILQWLSFAIDYFTKIKPLLKKGYIVIADRYVYTGMTRDAVNGAGRLLGHLLYWLVTKPDLLIYHDTPPNVCCERIKYRGKALFHTNKVILQNKHIKRKDLYYLNKLNNEYIHLLNDSTISNDTNIFYVHSDNCDVNECLDNYMSLKLDGNVKVQKLSKVNQ